mmetsp:Transcript_90/g.209  ORF Transcript_90/g.209 Transcript_90/m.209 type:complete len:89 (+) Transcript_90:70-336(+)|eukprot:CAMPEP_0179072478 /NCGR_PEP_ID=MMETSP0796-20121207/32077_1 /TAXON_ID=73915 /ORGANISM="Pyrodinium bahamense, Strain pbaha01" /LENGTH=88 /DNA_ID=CAMNT_0020769643 /DNA_START=68 /DNA_END=334 /DNA_ORIENTATION=+
MQNPGESVTLFARQQSLSCPLSRVFARSKGLALPMKQQAPVMNESSGQGWTMLKDYPFSTNGNALVGVLCPIGGALFTCIAVCRMLPK